MVLFQSDRLDFRCVTHGDYEDIKQLYMSSQVRKFLGGEVSDFAFSMKFSELVAENIKSLHFTIRRKDSQAFIGLMSLNHYDDSVNMELSYQILQRYWSKGYGTECVRSLIDYAFRVLNIKKIVAETQIANLASCRLLEKVGMTFEAEIERHGAKQAVYAICNDHLRYVAR